MIVTPGSSQTIADPANSRRPAQGAAARNTSSTQISQTPGSDGDGLQKLAGNVNATAAQAATSQPALQDSGQAKSLATQTLNFFQGNSQQALGAHSGLTAERVLQLLAD